MPAPTKTTDEKTQVRAILRVGLAAAIYVFRQNPMNKSPEDAFAEADKFVDLADARCGGDRWRTW